METLPRDPEQDAIVVYERRFLSLMFAITVSTLVLTHLIKDL